MASGTLPPLPMNPWETHALNYELTSRQDVAVPRDGSIIKASRRRPRQQDPLIYPGLYSSSGFDVMAILLRTFDRPNPRVDLGPIDCSVPLTICDLDLPDHPIVYASESFFDLTGYSSSEVIGRNCRFLQKPRNGLSISVSDADKAAKQLMRDAVHGRYEVQLQLTNYKRNGQAFTNILSIVPIKSEFPEHQYAIGFLHEVGS